MIQSADIAARAEPQPFVFAVAPMMDWTDRHCRFFHRAISRSARLYTEMITAAAVRHGDAERLLGFSALEHPLALQLGGNDPAELANAAVVGERFGYDEINLNCGCPSSRVQDGAFGACLMRTPARVADCVRAMSDAVSVPVTVKHRIGIGREEDYGFVRDFVGTVAEAGCRTFIVHARNAWLEGLSPKENRSVPPLRYEVVHRLASDFPALDFMLNGGLDDHDAIAVNRGGLQGVMVGRAAYQSPWMLAEVDARYGTATVGSSVTRDRWSVVRTMVDYAQREQRAGTPLRAIARHMLGLFNGLAGARIWRRMLSDAVALAENDPELLLRAAAVPMASQSTAIERSRTDDRAVQARASLTARQ